MFKPKQKHSLLLLMCTAVVVLGFVALASAYKRPYNETMRYAPQNLGIYDTYYCNFKESDCRACHGTTTAWRHHATQYAVSGQCATTCHIEAHNPYTNPERDCKVCHIDGTWVPIDIGYGVGNLGNPHHKSGAAAAWQCTSCHSSRLISDPNEVYVPQFDPTTITPTPFSCENCHWPSGNAAHQAPPLADWNLWTSYPRPTTWPDGLPHPAPIEANGAVTTGSVIAGDLPAPDANKPYRPDSGTHHEIDGAVVTGNCNLCHATSPGSDYIIDPANPLLIRGCENCHDIYTLHGELPGIGATLNGEHTTNGIGGLGLGGYNVGGTLDRIVTQNQKCVACHGDVVARPMPVDPGVVPDIDHLGPPMGSAGIAVTIYAGANQFGTRLNDDIVVMQQGSSANIEVPVISWNPDKIEFVVPGGKFAPGNANVRVVKRYLVETLADSIGNEDGICDPGEACHLQQRASSTALFYVRQHPILTTLSPDSGTWGTTVTINAIPGSFYNAREEVFNVSSPGYPASWTGYGYSTYVELVASNDKYRVTSMTGSGWSGDAGLGAWSDTSIKINLQKITVGGQIVGNLLDVNTNNPVPLADLYKGNWQLFVVTDYFKDDGAVAGKYMLKHSSGHLTGKIDTDTLLYREISDPLPWFSTDTPFISSVAPTSVKGGNLVALYGINFGTTQDTSYVEAGPCSPFVATFFFPGTTNCKVYQWANTRIVLRTPPVGSTKNGCFRVRVPKVLAPGSQTSNVSQQIKVYP